MNNLYHLEVQPAKSANVSPLKEFKPDWALINKYSAKPKYDLYEERIKRLIEARRRMSPLMIENRPSLHAARSMQKREYKKYVSQKCLELAKKQEKVDVIIKSLPNQIVGHNLKAEFKKTSMNLMRRTVLSHAEGKRMTDFSLEKMEQVVFNEEKRAKEMIKKLKGSKNLRATHSKILFADEM